MIELQFRQEPEMDAPANETSADELTLKSVDEGFKQETGPIRRRVEEFCALLVSRTEVRSAGNGKVSSSRRNYESISHSRNRYDTGFCRMLSKVGRQ